MSLGQTPRNCAVAHRLDHWLPGATQSPEERGVASIPSTLPAKPKASPSPAAKPKASPSPPAKPKASPAKPKEKEPDVVKIARKGGTKGREPLEEALLQTV